MKRKRPNHDDVMHPSRDRKVARRRRRRRRVVFGTIKVVFWTLILAGVFVFGIGIGRVVGGDNESTTKSVTLTGDRGVVTATLPVTTVTTTVTAPKKPGAAKGAGKAKKQGTTGARGATGN